MEKGNFNLIKSININGILEIIRAKGPISRADIAKLTSLTPASISKTTKKLIKIGILEEIGIGQTTGGRPPIMLKLKSKAAYIIGVYMGPNSLDFILADLDGVVITEKSFKLKNHTKDYILRNLILNLKEIINNTEEEIFGIGIAMNGIVDISKGISVFSPHYEWKNIELEKILEKELKLSVIVDNDVRAMARGEGKFGVAKESKNFLVVNISEGIGSALILNGEIYTGGNYSAGEIGHITVEEHSTKRCSCGNYGCLEALASTKAMIENIKYKLMIGEQSKYLKYENIDLDKIIKAAKKGDRLARDLIIENAKYLGKALATVINIVNPNLIVIIGEINKIEGLFYKNVETTIKRYGLTTTLKNLEIKPSILQEKSATIGAVTLILENLFKGKRILSHKV
ncbi:N-acetylglucosamine repressor [Hypnocyclicus thermotrophus]|uniref:N-acetylglucosamine repressor n=1 Tax=Hypnocyclicus thermotrophus TaxID=1627895 RepID=A0AA46DY38_9FUSO|nr:ROK family transcriptional regulator [Hypnocyclicus thermotrophus]TDT69725.1 N-acetylglucosamine repressor [Hypnocyclicus thermotrophus]